MKVCFVSNYMNHHQMPFSDAMYKRLQEEYTFIQTEAMEEERVRMGWNQNICNLPYMKYYYEEEDLCHKIIMESDVVIFGGTDEERYIEERLKAGKVIFRYSERLYKCGQWRAISPRGLIKKYHDHTRYRYAPVYLLCAGAYVPSDFHIVRAYPGKMYKWGYFPAFKEQDLDKLMEQKREKEKVTLLWAARFIDWKHPEIPVQLAEHLKREGYDFLLVMIGGGDMEQEIAQLVREKGVEDVVTLAGYRTPEQVRESMELADIYLITSDYKEGWGAVLNEAMNSGCAVVASHAIGAAPYVINHEEDGILYQSGNVEELVNQVKFLLTNVSKREYIGLKGYNKIKKLWNANVAADRLLFLFEQTMKKWEETKSHEKREKRKKDDFWAINSIWEDGPGSKAIVIGEAQMYRKNVGQV